MNEQITRTYGKNYPMITLQMLQCLVVIVDVSFEKIFNHFFFNRHENCRHENCRRENCRHENCRRDKGAS